MHRCKVLCFFFFALPLQERKLAAKMKLSQMEAELSAASDQLKALKESERSRKAMSVRSGHIPFKRIAIYHMFVSADLVDSAYFLYVYFYYRKQAIFTPGRTDSSTPRRTPKRIGL